METTGTWRGAAALSLAALLPLAHVLLYPLASLSTLEAKPRGTYFEDNALLPNSAPPSFSFDSVPRAPSSSTSSTSSGVRTRTSAPGAHNKTASDDASESDEAAASGQRSKTWTPPAALAPAWGGAAAACGIVEGLGLACHAFSPSLVYAVARPTFTDDAKEVLALLVLPPRARLAAEAPCARGRGGGIGSGGANTGGGESGGAAGGSEINGCCCCGGGSSSGSDSSCSSSGSGGGRDGSIAEAHADSGARLVAPLLAHVRSSRWLAKTVVLLLPGGCPPARARTKEPLARSPAAGSLRSYPFRSLQLICSAHGSKLRCLCHVFAPVSSWSACSGDRGVARVAGRSAGRGGRGGGGVARGL